MDSLYFLIPIAIVFVVIAVKIFFWAVSDGQYDDLETEARRILFDDDLPENSQGDKHSNDKQASEKSAESRAGNSE